MTTEQLPAPVIPAHSTTFPADKGSVSVYRDGECVTMVIQYQGVSHLLLMHPEGALLLSSSILQPEHGASLNLYQGTFRRRAPVHRSL